MTSPVALQNPVIRSVHSSTASNENATVTTGADTAAGDLLVAFHANDWDTAALMGAPTGSDPAGTVPQSAWGSSIATGDRGSNAVHVKAWSRRVTTGGAQRVSATYAAKSDVGLIVVVLQGSTVDPDAPIDVATNTNGAATVNHAAGSVTTRAPAELFFVAAATADSGTSGKPVATYTPPTGLTSLLRVGSNPTPADSIASGEWLTLGVFGAYLAAAAATNVRTAVSSAARPYATVTVAVRGAPQRTPIVITTDPARVTAAAPAAPLEKSGRTLDLVAARARTAVTALPGGKTVTVAPLNVRVTVPATPLRRTVRTAPGWVEFVFPDLLVANMTISPVRVRVGVIHPVAEVERNTVLTERVSRTYVRPRKNLRFLAQEVLTRRWVSWDLELNDPSITWKRNAPTELTASISARELYRLGLDEWAHFIHCEQDGRIRASTILQPWSPGGANIDITGSGVTRYPAGMPYQGEFALGNPVGVKIDPLDVVRDIWRHLQSYPEGKLGVVVAGTRSTVRIGEPERDTEFETAAGEQVAFTSGPYLLKWWEDTDCGGEIDDLAKSTPFDYREAPAWNSDRSDVIQYVELGYPRLGRYQDALSFTDGENLTLGLTPVEDDDRFASDVTLLGSGEGTSRIRGRYTRRVPGRVRRAVTVEKKDISSVARANAFARDEAIRRAGSLSFDEVHLKARHRNAPFGSFVVGDDIPIRATVDGYGRVDLRHRVEALEWRPHADTLVATTRRSDTYDYGTEGAPA